MKDLYRIVKAAESGESFVVATVVDTKGSAPGKLGFRMLVFADRSEGSVGGGALELSVVRDAREMIRKRDRAFLRQYSLSDLEMSCGGEVTVFFEPCGKKVPLWIFGAGHIARALAPIAQPLGFAVSVVDNREGFAIPEHFPEGCELRTADFATQVERVPQDAYAVIVSHGHAHDEEILAALLCRRPTLPYIGMIGSRPKVTLMHRNLVQKGVIWGDRVYAPIGLNLGGDSAEEIALAIAAEMMGLMHGKTNLPHCRIDTWGSP